jgi:hypothetical protein
MVGRNLKTQKRTAISKKREIEKMNDPNRSAVDIATGKETFDLNKSSSPLKDHSFQILETRDQQIAIQMQNLN